MEISNYSITQDATTQDLSDLFTGVGQVNINLLETPDTPYLLSSEISIIDFVGIEHTSVVQQIQSRDGEVSLIAEDILRRFNVDKWLAPARFFDTEITALEGIIEYMCAEVRVNYDFRYETLPHTEKFTFFPGGKVNLWEELKELAVVHKFDLRVEGTTLIVENLNTRRVELADSISEGWSGDVSNIANRVEVTWFDDAVKHGGDTTQVDLEYYPRGNNEEAQIIQVDANETTEVELDVNAWVYKWNQPECVEWVDNRTYDESEGVYSVVGNDNLPIMPAQWLDTGGSLTVESTDDPARVIVKVIGADLPELAPFRIAMSSGNHYNSLHLTGWAYIWEKKTIQIDTGAGIDLTAQDMGAQVESRHVQTRSQAYDVAYRIARTYAGPNLTFESDALDGEFPGTILEKPDANFRVTQRVASPAGVNLQAKEHTLIEDFNSVWEVGMETSQTYVWTGSPNNSSSQKIREGEVLATNLYPNPKPLSNTWERVSTLVGTTSSLSYLEWGSSPSQRAVRLTIVTSLGAAVIADTRVLTFDHTKKYRFSWALESQNTADHGVILSLSEVNADGTASENRVTIWDSGTGSNPPINNSQIIDFKHIPPPPHGYRLTLEVRFSGANQSTYLGGFMLQEAEDEETDWFDGSTPNLVPGRAPTFGDFNAEFSGRMFQDFATTPLRRING